MAHRINFGTLRFIELYNDDESENQQEYEAFLHAFGLPHKLKGGYKVIGSINAMSPLLQLSEKSSGPVFVFDEMDTELVRLANNRMELLQILEWIGECWNSYSAEMFLPRNPETIAQYRQFVQKIKEVPGIDAAYWIDFAFKELDIRYEV
jgi:hypothetical protein